MPEVFRVRGMVDVAVKPLKPSKDAISVRGTNHLNSRENPAGWCGGRSQSVAGLAASFFNAIGGDIQNL